MLIPQAEKVMSLAPRMVHTYDFSTMEVLQNGKVIFSIVFPSEKVRFYSTLFSLCNNNKPHFCAGYTQLTTKHHLIGVLYPIVSLS